MNKIIIFLTTLTLLFNLPNGIQYDQQYQRKYQEEKPNHKLKRIYLMNKTFQISSLKQQYLYDVQPKMSNVHLNESDEMKNATKDVINLITGHDYNNNNNNYHDYDETGLIEDEEEDMELIDELKEYM